jgi:molybdopterin/thiamine biosynthesis adenylyltransferase
VPSVHGGVARTGGQWMLTVPGVSACLECVFPEPVDAGLETAAGCSALGILAPVAGVVGAMQALMTIAFLKRPGRAIAGRLHVYEATGARSRHVDFPPSADCPCGAARRQETFQEDRRRIAAAH